MSYRLILLVRILDCSHQQKAVWQSRYREFQWGSGTHLAGIFYEFHFLEKNRINDALTYRSLSRQLLFVPKQKRKMSYFDLQRLWIRLGATIRYKILRNASKSKLLCLISNSITLPFCIRLEYFNTLVQVCENDVSFDLPGNFDNSKYLEILQHLAPNSNEIFVQCYFRDFKKNCGKKFSPSITELGLCYTFNSLPGNEIYRTSEYWNLKCSNVQKCWN